MGDKRVMIFPPHPDDGELAMGGTIAKLIDEGWDVVVADMSSGEPTPAGSREIRAAETEKASTALGITRRINLGLPNRFFEENIESRVTIAEAIREYKPRWLFGPFRPDAHPDHIHASRLIEDARFHAKLTKTEMKHDPHHPEKIIYFYATHLRVHPNPSFVVDVTPYWDRKIEAVHAYRSQFWDNQPEEKQGWILEHVEALCRYFGNRIGVKYGEPFFCHELVGLNDLGSLL